MESNTRVALTDYNFKNQPITHFFVKYFPKTLAYFQKTIYFCTRNSEMNAQMAESVDALVSNTSGATHPGSIPGLGTKKENQKWFSFFMLYYEKQKKRFESPSKPFLLF